MKRLQKSSWYNLKDSVIIENFAVSNNGNICVFGIEKNTDEKICHWLNDTEKKNFDKSKFTEIAWASAFNK